jgi:2-C-methyl-D-erythritol 4-phosphate cytidylyltransferase
MSDNARAECWALLPASGKGKRMGADRPKQYLEVAGQPILQHTLERLLSHPGIDGVVLVLAADDQFWPGLGLQFDKPVILAEGGAERFLSVRNGLARLAEQCTADALVLIHDAVRPLVTHHDLDRLIEQASLAPDGALLATPVADTLKRDDGSGRVVATQDRRHLWRACTPQAFSLELILQALDDAIAQGLLLTDDASAMEAAGYRPKLVQCDPSNFKITHPSDIRLAEVLLGWQQA